MLQALLRAGCLALVRLFYPHRRAVGQQHLPATGAAILVANHRNSLVDPLLLWIALRRPVRFLAKSTFFEQPLGRFAMQSFQSIPVHRAQDYKDGPQGEGERNQATFALCRAALRQGQWLALFPEGTSHSDPQLRPLKTGAARIALSAAAELPRAAGGAEVVLVPVGLSYDAKATFRSGVLLVFGQPLPVQDRLADYRRDEHQAVERLTDDIRAALDEVVLQAETRDLLEGVARVAASPDLLAGYRRLRERDPDRALQIVRAARDHARVLAHLGVRDPWAVEVPRVHPGRALLALGKLISTAPLAALGALLWWIPYRLAGQVAPKITRGEDDLLGTVKILAGALFIALFWIAEIVAAGLLRSWPGALVIAALAPPAGYAAMRLPELAADAAEAWRQLWLRRPGGPQLDRLMARRRAIADELARALAEVRSPAR